MMATLARWRRFPASSLLRQNAPQSSAATSKLSHEVPQRLLFLIRRGYAIEHTCMVTPIEVSRTLRQSPLSDRETALSTHQRRLGLMATAAPRRRQARHRSEPMKYVRFLSNRMICLRGRETRSDDFGFPQRSRPTNGPERSVGRCRRGARGCLVPERGLSHNSSGAIPFWKYPPRPLNVKRPVPPPHRLA
jgi:hypothetical protein